MKKSPPIQAVILLSAGLPFLLTGPAAAQFREMASRVPRSANALVLLNVEKILQSPEAVREGWKEKADKAFESGVTRIPPNAARYVMASQIDFESMRPLWEAAVIDLTVPPSMEKIARASMGTRDKIGDVPAIVLPSDAYVLQLGPKTLGAIAPANRQEATRWIRQMGDKKSPSLSPYLQKGAGYSEDAGTEIIMVLDLDGVFPPERVLKYLKDKKLHDQSPADRADLAGLLAGIQGLRAGVRIGETPFGKVTLDLANHASKTAPDAKGLLVEALADAGMKIGDLDAWTAEAKGKTISLSGELTDGGLRRLLSIVESPVPAETAAKEAPAASQTPEPPSPGDLAANQGPTTLNYFRSVDRFLGELKSDMRDMKTWGQAAVWFDKYARKIERLSMLGVDPEMLDYGKFVATGLRSGALDTRNINIQAGVDQYQVAGGSSAGYNPYYYGGYGYDRGMYGGGWFGPSAGAGSAWYAAEQAMRDEGRQKRVIRTRARGDIATAVQSIKDQIARATGDVRSKMTERYQLDF